MTNVVEQQRAARLTGFLYLLTNATAIFAFSIRGRLIVNRDVMQTAANIVGSEWLFRLAIVAELITIAAVIVLIAALYVLLRSAGPNIALLAVFWRLAENFTLAIIVLAEFAILRIVHVPAHVQTVYALLGIYGDGFRIGFFFLGLGSAAFAYLWL